MQVFTKLKIIIYFLTLLLFVTSGWPAVKATTLQLDENDAPTVSGLPSDVTVQEDAQDNEFDISSATIADSDAGSGELTLILEATGGIFNVAAGNGITITGHMTSRLTLTGNLTDLNQYISISSNNWFVPDHNLYGNDAAVVKVFINDNGNTGSGGGTDIFIGNVNVDITAVNDAPEASLPATIEVTEDANSALAGISFADVDAASGSLSVIFSVPAGTLTASSSGGVNVSGSGTGNLMLAGILNDVNAFIAASNLTFLNQPGNTNDQTLTVSVNDNGNTGNGGSLIAGGSAIITVLPAMSITPGDPGNFITTWQTDNPGTSADNQITIPTEGTGYNYHVYWEHVNDPGINGTETGVTGDLTITFPSAGTYRVEITGDFPRIYFGSTTRGGDREKITSIEQWGDIAWTSMNRAFSGAVNLEGHATDTPDLRNVTDLEYMFVSAIAFNGDLSGWDVSTVTNMRGMFVGAGAFNSDISSWNVSNVTDMFTMFDRASAFNQDISGWDVSGVTDMGAMFTGATAFDQDISNWDVGAVTDMQDMLSGSGLSSENYDAILIGWAGQSGLNSNVTLGAGGLLYCEGAEARQSLIDDHGWTINGDAIAADCDEGNEINPGENNVLYVDINVNTEAAGYTGAGDSWANAVPQFRDALAWAASDWNAEVNGTLQVWVAAGVYYPDKGGGQTDNDRSATFQFLNNVEVYGGFAGTEANLEDRNVEANPTVLSGDIDGNDNPFAPQTDSDGDTGTPTQTDHIVGDNSFHVVTCSGTDATARLDGFTITAGLANEASSPNDRGAGIYNADGSPTLTNVTFAGNSAYVGAGIYNEDSSPTLTNIAFAGNSGGGMYNLGSSPTLTNVTFSGNSSSTNGGGIYNEDSSPTLTSVTFTGNRANFGGGLYNVNFSSPVLANVIFTGNSSDVNGGGMANFNSNPILTNVTLSGNSAGSLGGGMFNLNNSGASEPILTNVIIWGNQAGGSTETASASIHNSNENSNPTISFSLIANSGGSGTEWNPDIGNDGGNNIDIDPQFLDPVNPGDAPTTAGNLRFADGSPAIDMGDPNTDLLLFPTDEDGAPIDLDGNPRVFDPAGNGVIDIGAYEFQGESGPACPAEGDSIVYVDASADEGGNGFTWGTAFNSLQDALDLADTCDQVKQIWVASGVYTPTDNPEDREATFQLLSGVEIYGGFDPTEGADEIEERDWEAHPTVLSGNIVNPPNDPANAIEDSGNPGAFSFHVVTGSGTDRTAKLDGFIITGGNATGESNSPTSSGGGMRNENGSPTLIDISFAGNSAVFAGGMLNMNSSPLLMGVTFSDNSAGNLSGSLGNGGGMANSGNSSPMLIGVTFSGNSSAFSGGAMYNTPGSAPVLKGVIFTGNSTANGAGGGMANFNSSPMLTSVIFTGNSTTSAFGGGMYNQDGSSPTLTNVTFADNSAIRGGGVYNSGSSPVLTNVIIWGNQAGGSTTTASASIFNSDSNPTISFSLIANSGGSEAWNDSLGSDGGNNIDLDPVFTDPTIGDYSLQGTSPAVNAGSNQAYTDAGGDLANDLDLAGNPRVYAGNPDPDVIDMGAYEFQGGDPVPAIVNLSALDTVHVAYGTAWDAIENLPTEVIAKLSDSTEVAAALEGNTGNWTLLEPEGGAYDGEAAGSYVFAVPLVLPDEADDPYFTNPDNLQAEVIITIDKGSPALTASWNGTAIDPEAGLSLAYGDSGTLAFTSTDPDAEITYGFGEGDTTVLNLDNLETVMAQQAGTATLIVQQEETDNFETTSLNFVVTVAQKAIAIIPDADQNKVYGSEDPENYTYKLADGSTLVTGDTLTEIVSGNSREVGENAGEYDIILAFEGEKAHNYDITFEEDNNAFSVIPLDILVAAADQQKVYGTEDPGLTYTVTPGLLGDDSFTGMLERETGEDVGAYTITQGTLTAGDNYAITFETGTLTITTADYEDVSFADAEFTYDGTEHTLAITGDLPEGVMISYENNGLSDVGTVTVTAMIDGGDNYEDMSLEAELSIAPLPITVTAENKTKVYGAADPALTYTFTPELIGEDSFTGALEREPGEAAGTYAITQGDLSAGDNYAITFDPGTFTITQGGYEDIAFNDASFTYDGTEHQLTINGDLPEGVTVSYTIDGERGNGAMDVGTHEVTALIDGGDNYEDRVLTAKLSITPLPITVAAENKTKVYGTPDPALTYTAAPELIGSDAFSGSLTRGEGEDVGEYAITQGSLTAGANYDITFAGADFEISPANLSDISFADAEFIYDGTEHQLAISGDLPEGATVSYEGNGRRNVGEQIVTAHIDGGMNYSDLHLEAGLRVTPLAITLTAENKTKTFGKADPALSYTNAPSLIAGDSFSGSLSREPGENVGSYAIMQGDLSAGGNYSITFTPGTLTISPGTRRLAFEALPAKTYGDADFDPGAKVSGSDEEVIYSSSNPGVAEIHDGKIRITGAGSTEITATLPENPNYEDTPLITRELLVRKAPQSIDFAPIGDISRDAGIISLDVVASSGLPVTLTSSDQQVAVVAGEIELEILRLGTSQITATQAGNENYLPAEPVSRELKVTDPNNKLVKVHPVVSPNSDGINELLLIEGIRDYPENRVTIVNRNGVKVFEMKGYDNGSRTFRGLSNTVTSYDFLPQGTYFYLAEISTGGGWKRETGWFVLKYSTN